MRDAPTALPHRPREVQVALPNGPISLWTPAGADALLELLAEEPPDPDDKMPYWADLWPSAVAIAEAIETEEIHVAGRSVLELGAGLGLCSLAAARNGADVLATDWDQDALDYIHASAKLNQLSVETRCVDWRAPGDTKAASVLLMADVLYEARNVDPLVSAIHALLADGGEAWLADPGRDHLVTFVRAAKAFRFAHKEHAVVGLGPKPVSIELLRLVKD